MAALEAQLRQVWLWKIGKGFTKQQSNYDTDVLAETIEAIEK